MKNRSCAHETSVILRSGKAHISSLLVKGQRQRPIDRKGAAVALVQPAHHVQAEDAAGRGASFGELRRTLDVLGDAPALSKAARKAALAVAAAEMLPRTQQLVRSGVIWGNTCAAKKKKP